MDIQENYKEILLENGFLIISQKVGQPLIHAKLRVHSGPLYEDYGQEGIAHLLEHCLFSGGSKKYLPEYADEIRSEFGYYNSFLDLEKISFECKMLPEDFEKWIDLISDHIFNPRFEIVRCEIEKKRVLNEISEIKNNPYFEPIKKFRKIFYKGHPKEKLIFGLEEIIKNIERKDVINFYEKNFYPNNMDLIIAGDLPENYDELIYKYFGNQKPGKILKKEIKDRVPLKGAINIKEKINNQRKDLTNITLAFKVPDKTKIESYPIRLISYLLGGDNNSILFKNISLKNGLVYHVNSIYNGDFNFGEIQINLNVPTKNQKKIIDMIFSEIDYIKNRELPYSELRRIKKAIKYKIANSLSSLDGISSFIESKIENGLTLNEKFKEYTSITPKEIIETSNKYLPTKDKGDYVLLIIEN